MTSTRPRCGHCRLPTKGHARCDSCGVLIGPRPHLERDLTTVIGLSFDVVHWAGVDDNHQRRIERVRKANGNLGLCPDCLSHTKKRQLRLDYVTAHEAGAVIYPAKKKGERDGD